MKLNQKKIQQRTKRRKRVRAVVFGTATKPRLSVFRSSVHTYAQLIDDSRGKTIAHFSSLNLRGKHKGKKSDLAKQVGHHLGKVALDKGIKKISFDRGGYAYHGRIKAVAEGARESGLEF